MENKNIINEKEEIQRLGLEALKHYFKIDPKNLSKETLSTLHQRAKLGMSFEREMNLNSRAIENNYIRVFKSIAKDRDELKRFIQKTMPKYSPS
jgi:hypothetical protein